MIHCSPVDDNIYIKHSTFRYNEQCLYIQPFIEQIMVIR